MFNRFKSLVATPKNNFERTTGNFNYTGAYISINNKLAYRYDSRSPDEIKKNGFAGTLSRETEEIRVFGEQNVFASRSKEGAKKFLDINQYVGREKMQHLYEINTKGMPTFSFVENKNINSDALIENIAEFTLQRALVEFPRDQARLFAREAIENLYCSVDELHINGPIPSSRIKHITTILVK